MQNKDLVSGMQRGNQRNDWAWLQTSLMFTVGITAVLKSCHGTLPVCNGTTFYNNTTMTSSSDNNQPNMFCMMSAPSLSVNPLCPKYQSENVNIIRKVQLWGQWASMLSSLTGSSSGLLMRVWIFGLMRANRLWVYEDCCRIITHVLLLKLTSDPSFDGSQF